MTRRPPVCAACTGAHLQALTAWETDRRGHRTRGNRAAAYALIPLHGLALGLLGWTYLPPGHLGAALWWFVALWWFALATAGLRACGMAASPRRPPPPAAPTTPRTCTCAAPATHPTTQPPN